MTEPSETQQPAAFAGAQCPALPRRPWVLSNQYGMRFVLSQDNEIIFRQTDFDRIGSEMMRLIVDAVNHAPNEKLTDHHRQ